MDLPLYEDDLDAEGVIRASAITPHRPDMPSAAVLCWFPEVVADVGTRSAAVTVLRSELGRSPVWRTTGPGGTSVAVLHPGVGAPLAAMFLEHLVALGVRTVVGVGGAGALQHELTLGHAVAAANAAALVADPEPTGFGAANVCSGEPHTIGDLAAELARAMDGPEPEIVGGARPGDVRHVVADPAYAASRLGFRARTSFTDGVTAFATDPLRSPIAPNR